MGGKMEGDTEKGRKRRSRGRGGAAKHRLN